MKLNTLVFRQKVLSLSQNPILSWHNHFWGSNNGFLCETFELYVTWDVHRNILFSIPTYTFFSATLCHSKEIFFWLFKFFLGLAGSSKIQHKLNYNDVKRFFWAKTSFKYELGQKIKLNYAGLETSAKSIQKAVPNTGYIKQNVYLSWR